jgi:predicted HAD superfamily hydrolase
MFNKRKFCDINFGYCKKGKKDKKDKNKKDDEESLNSGENVLESFLGKGDKDSKIEREYKFENFKAIRLYAAQLSNNTFDDIYIKFQELTKLNNTAIEALKQYEIETEINHIYIIKENYNKINDGDIIVSDMYFSQNIIRYILKSKNLYQLYC